MNMLGAFIGVCFVLKVCACVDIPAQRLGLLRRSQSSSETGTHDKCRDKLLVTPSSINSDTFKEVHYWRTNSNLSISEESPSICSKGTEKWHFFAYGGINPQTKNKSRFKLAKVIAKNASLLSYIDEARAFHPEDIDPVFAKANRALLHNPRCFNMLSKVYFLHHLLTNTSTSVKDGDVVMYLDSDMEIVNERGLHLLACLAKNSEKGIAPFHFNFWFEKLFTKRDTMLALGMDNSDALDTLQVQTGAFAFVKNRLTLQFVEDWLKYSILPQHMTLSPSRARNHPEFWTHKEDQSIFSLLIKKYNIKSFPTPYVNYPAEMDPLAIEAGYCDERVEMAYVYYGWSTMKSGQHISGQLLSAMRKPQVRLPPSYREMLLHRNQSFLLKSCLN